MVKDSIRDVFPIAVDFAQGEQPTEAKFDGWAMQTNAGLDMLSKALGDPWGDAFTSNPLFVDVIRPTHIANLTRLIGPASALSPLRQGFDTINATIVNAVPAGVNEFMLPYPPLDVSLTGDVGIPSVAINGAVKTFLQSADTTACIAFKDSKNLLATAGDYHIDIFGRVFTYTPTTGFGTGGAYACTMFPDSYSYARFNVYPDLNQSTKCTVTDIGSGNYTVQVPTITAVAYRNANGNPLLPAAAANHPFTPPANFTGKLPRVITNGLTGDEDIPEGFMFLWDHILNEIVANASFKRNSGSPETTVTVSGATGLDTETNRYSLFTVGTTITELLSAMRFNLIAHTHDGQHGEQAVEHKELGALSILPSEVLSEWSLTVKSPPSQVIGNDHPQYLCKYGWMGTNGDAGQYDNAMLGDIFMANVQTDYIANSYIGGNDISSRSICFGNASHRLNRNHNVLNNGICCSSDFCVGASSDISAKFLFGDQSHEDNGLLWDLDENYRYYFKHEGSVANAHLQVGDLWAISSTNPIDVTSPGSVSYVHVDGAGSAIDFKTPTSLCSLVMTSSYFEILTAQNIFIESTSSNISMLASANISISNLNGEFNLTASDDMILNATGDCIFLNTTLTIIGSSNTSTNYGEARINYLKFNKTSGDYASFGINVSDDKSFLTTSDDLEITSGSGNITLKTDVTTGGYIKINPYTYIDMYEADHVRIPCKTTSEDYITSHPSNPATGSICFFTTDSDNGGEGTQYFLGTYLQSEWRYVELTLTGNNPS